MKYMKNYNQREKPQMHHAVCSDCGRDCEVPFRPSGNKPVYCSDCFGAKEDSGGGRRERKSFDRAGRREKKMFSAVCDKCHSDCEVPFKPTGNKPVYCSDCFGSVEKRTRTNNSAKSFSSDQHKKQFEVLNEKLDDIIKMLSSKNTAKKVNKKEKTVVTMPRKKAKEKIKAKKVIVKKAVKKVAAVKKSVKKKEAPKKVVKKSVKRRRL